MPYMQTEKDSADNIYVNVVFDHTPPYDNLPTSSEESTQAEYRVTKTIPILDKASDYYCSVIRFDLPLNIVPLYIFPIIPNQANPNLSPMIIGVRTGGVNFSQNLIYVANNPYTAPSQVGAITQVITPYYFVYQYQNLIDSLNTALAAAFVAAGSPGGGTAPYFFFDPVTQFINLIANNTFITAPATLFWNESLNNYLDAFHVNFLGYNQPQGRVFDFIFDTGNNFLAPVPPFIAGDRKYSQQYNVINYWSSLRKIIITSNSIPIQNEFTPSNNSGISATLPIITDFVPSLEFAGQGRSIAYYYPTGQYRLVDMKSDLPLYTIDFKVYWQDKHGNTYPLNISIFQQGSIKLAFLKKSIYKPMNLLLR